LRLAAKLDTLARTVTAILAAIGAVATAVMIAHVLADVLGRMLFNHPLPGTTNLVSTWWLPVVALAGLALAARKDEHIQASLLYNPMGPVNRRRLEILDSVITLVALVAIGWCSLERALRATSLATSDPITGLAVWPVVFVVPLAFAGFALEVLSTLVRLSTRKEVRPDVRA